LYDGNVEELELLIDIGSDINIIESDFLKDLYFVP